MILRLLLPFSQRCTEFFRTWGDLSKCLIADLQGIRELVEKYTLFTNRTAPKTFLYVLRSDQRVLTPKAQYISFIQANPTELDGIRCPSWQEMSVGSTELPQSLLLAQGSRRALLPSVTSSFYNLALLMNSWRHVSMDLHYPN